MPTPPAPHPGDTHEVTPRPSPAAAAGAAAADDLVSGLLDVSRALVGIAVYSVNAAPVDLTVTQYRLMAVVAANGPQTITEVAVSLGVAQSNASRHCDRLERLELLLRARSPSDGRVVLVDLTESGREVVALVTDVRRREISRVLETMGGPSRARILDAARAFNRAAADLDEHPWLSAAW